MPDALAVELLDVSKRFGTFAAVDGVSLAVPAGSVYGFIGPNGSGKTTTLRMIVRIYLPDDGTVRVLGQDRHGPANDRVSYLPEERSIYKNMPVRDTLRFYAQLKGHEPSDREIDGWLERIELPGVGAKKVSQLSKGMNQKVQFVAAVISKPELVLLDEPFSGLDPVNAVVLRDMVGELKRAGTTVIFSTHDMRLAEEMCDRVFMIHKGRKVLDGTVDQVRRQHGGNLVRVRFADAGVSTYALPGVASVAGDGAARELVLQDGADPSAALGELVRRGARLELFEVAAPSLQDIFVRIAAPGREAATAMA